MASPAVMASSDVEMSEKGQQLRQTGRDHEVLYLLAQSASRGGARFLRGLVRPQADFSNLLKRTQH